MVRQKIMWGEESVARCHVRLDYLSKPVVLLYKKEALTALDLIAAQQLERGITLNETGGLAAHGGVVAVGQNIVALEADFKHLERMSLAQQLDIWIAALAQRKIPAGAVLDLVVDRKTMHAVDRRFYKTNGWARTQLIIGLKLWTWLFLEGKD